MLQLHFLLMLVKSKLYGTTDCFVYEESVVHLVFAIVLPPTFLFSRLVFSAYFNLDRGPQMDTFGDCFKGVFSDPILFLILLPRVAPGL